MSEKRAKLRETVRKALYAAARNPAQTVDAMSMLGCGYIAYKSTGSAYGFVVGPLLYRMATSPGGTPPIGKCVGIVGLAAIGMRYMDVDMQEVMKWFLGDLPIPPVPPPSNPDPVTPDNPEGITDQDFQAAFDMCQAEGAPGGSLFLACMTTKLINMGYTKEQIIGWKWPWE